MKPEWNHRKLPKGQSASGSGGWMGLQNACFRVPFVMDTGREWHCGTVALFCDRIFSCSSLPLLTFTITPISDLHWLLSKLSCTRIQWCTNLHFPSQGGKKNKHHHTTSYGLSKAWPWSCNDQGHKISSVNDFPFSRSGSLKCPPLVLNMSCGHCHL